MSWEQALDRYLTTPPECNEKPMYECCVCGSEIYEGDEYYEINGDIYCEECIESEFKKTAEALDYESED